MQSYAWWLYLKHSMREQAGRLEPEKSASPQMFSFEWASIMGSIGTRHNSFREKKNVGRKRAWKHNILGTIKNCGPQNQDWAFSSALECSLPLLCIMSIWEHPSFCHPWFQHVSKQKEKRKKLWIPHHNYSSSPLTISYQQWSREGTKGVGIVRYAAKAEAALQKEQETLGGGFLC